MIANSIKISTFESTCSAIILPCYYSKNENGYKYYIILTTVHLIISKNVHNEIVLLKKEPEKYLKLDIFDDEDRSISYEIVDVFIGKSVLQEDDVCAMLLKVKNNYDFSLTQKVNFNKIEFEKKVKTCCFPSVIKNEEICNKIILKGFSNPSYSSKTTMQSYRITDDYHHYTNLKDLTLLEGLSGAPVFTEDNILIGMNQSIPYFMDGENPFKTVYFITIKHIFDYLRESGCVLYEKIDDDIRIEWIYQNEKSEDKEDLSILVIGSSGAGKSSFIKSFALHKEFIDASGDGQTTRTDVEYNFSIYEKEPRAEINFIDKKKFIEKRRNDILLDIISFCFIYRFRFKELDIYEDNLCYFKEIYSKLNLISKYVRDEKLNKILNKIEPILYSINEQYYLEIVDQYWEILIELESLTESISICKMQYIFNDDLLDKLYFKLVEYREFEKRSILYKEIDVVEKNVIDLTNAILDKNTYLDLIDNENNTNIIKLILNIDDFIISKSILLHNSQEIKESLKKIFCNKKGFFSIHEFDFLVDNTIESKFKALEKKHNESYLKYNYDTKFSTENNGEIYFDNIIYCIYKNIIDDRVEKNFYNEVLVSCIEDVFQIFYITIKESVEAYIEKNFYECMEDDELFNLEKQNLCFKFNDFDEKKKLLLSKCLKTVMTKNNMDSEEKRNKQIDSLTAIIKKVVIKDSFSNQLALLFYNLNINRISFLDTHGLDHIEKGINKKRLLQDFITEKKLDRESKENKAKRGLDAVFYIKKLDSGRPTELEHIIPMIYEVEPAVSLYCIFTGIDIFYHKQLSQSIHWKENSLNNPKSVQYLFSQELRETIYKKLQFSQLRNESIYFTLVKNIGAFCNVNDTIFNTTNRENIKKILISIIIKEKDSIDIISKDLISKLKNIECNQEVGRELRILLLRFFKTASISNWYGINGNTAKANARRINNECEGQLGYQGVNRHRWDLLFNDAYDKVFSKYTKNLINALGENDEKVEAILINLKEKFLGKSYEIYSFSESDNPFRKILEKLYKSEKNNPFYVSERKKIGNDMYTSREYLNDVVNFYKLITKNNSILDEFMKLYTYELIKALNEDRDRSINNILKYSQHINIGIMSAYNDIKNVFNINATDKKNNEIVKVQELFYEICKELVKKNENYKF